MDLIRQINTHEYLYLDRLVEITDLQVEFWIREAGSQGRKIDSGQNLTSITQITSGEGSKLYRILFEGYIAFAVFNESFEKLPREITLYSRLFQIIPTSAFLDYVMAHADMDYAESVAEQKLMHYRLNCLNHVIDMATCFAPSIEVTESNSDVQ